MSEKIKEESRTIAKMVGIYCHAKHGTHQGLCESCQSLLDYAHLRLSRCPFGVDKPVCTVCPVHCYQADYRERVREVMRFAGPRMLLVDPVAAVKHLVSLRQKPSLAVQRIMERKNKQTSQGKENAQN